MATPSPVAQAPWFHVLIETSSARIGGPGGTLSVYQGVLILAPSRSAQRIFKLESELRHSDHHVGWVRQPLFPPWINQAIDFAPDTGVGLIRLRFSPFVGRRLRPFLIAAGFSVTESRSWSFLIGPPGP